MGRNSGELGILKRNEGVVGTLVLFSALWIGFKILTPDETIPNCGFIVVMIVPTNLDNGGLNCVHSRLDQPRSFHDVIYHVMIVARQNDWKIKLLTRFVILGCI
jgi:hypothetical protein